MLDLYLFIASIFFYGFGKLNDSLPITVSNGLIFICFAYHVAGSVKKGYIYYSPFLIIFLLYALLSTILNIGSGSTFDKIQFFIYFFIYSFTAIAVVKKHDTETLIKAYMAFCFVISAIAVIQVSGDFAGLNFVNDMLRALSENKNSSYSGGLLRATSIASEPALLGIYLLPATALSIYRLLNISEVKKYSSTKISITIIIATLLTFSLVSYISLMMIVFSAIAKKNNIKAIAAILIILSALYAAATSVESINSRLTEVTASSGLASSDNLSVIAFNSNLKVTIYGLSENLFFGTGITSHPEKFDRFVGLFYSASTPGIGLNKDDAASMILRLLSELGIIGLVLYYHPAMLHLFRAKKESNHIVQSAFFISFILYGIRYGSINTPMHWLYFSVFFTLHSAGLRRFRFSEPARFSAISTFYKNKHKNSQS